MGTFSYPEVTSYSRDIVGASIQNGTVAVAVGSAVAGPLIYISEGGLRFNTVSKNTDP